MGRSHREFAWVRRRQQWRRGRAGNDNSQSGSHYPCTRHYRRTDTNHARTGARSKSVTKPCTFTQSVAKPVTNPVTKPVTRTVTENFPPAPAALMALVESVHR